MPERESACRSGLASSRLCTISASQVTDDTGRAGISKSGKHGHSDGMSSCAETRSVAPFPTQSTHHQGLGDWSSAALVIASSQEPDDKHQVSREREKPES